LPLSNSPPASRQTLASAELIRVAKEFGFEGIVAKRRDSLYEPGKRSGAWLKYQINRGQEFVIGGYVLDNPFDSIIVGYYQDGKLMYAAKVRNGFVPHTRREVAAKLKGLQMTPAPSSTYQRKSGRNGHSHEKK